MIDHEYKVYTELKTYMLEKYPALGMASMEQSAPPSFPFLSFEQKDNPIAMERYYGFEQFVAPRFVMMSYADNNDKVLAKEILQAADDYMSSKGFIRTFGPQKVTNDLSNVCQMTTIYDGNLMDKNAVVYRR